MNDSAAATAEKIIDGEVVEMHIVRSQPQPSALSTELQPSDLREKIARLEENRTIMIEYVQRQMVAGHHYYTFSKLGKEQPSFNPNGPRDDKPALTQDGAHNIASLFTVAFGEPQVKVQHHGDGHFDADATVPLIHLETQKQVAVGRGSCTTRETKYRYRKGERECPACGEPKINRSKYPPKNAPAGTPPAWYCYTKIGGCGAEFAADDNLITEQTVGRVENQDLADLENTVLKMAIKRAKVSGVNQLPLVSEIFRPGLAEDLAENEPPPSKQAKEKKSPATSATAPPASNGPTVPLIVQTAIDLAYKLQKEWGMSFDDLAKQFLPEGVAQFSALTADQATAIVPGLSELINTKLQQQKEAA